MSDTTETTETVEETEVQPEGETTEETTETDETTEQKPEASPEDELPEWARKELTKVRGEAANYRTKLREAQKSLADAKSPEDFEAARSELSTKIAELEHEIAVGTVARKYDIPDALLPLLAKVSGDELETAAKALQSHAAPAAPESLSGGLDPDDGEDAFDPAALARQARASRY